LVQKKKPRIIDISTQVLNIFVTMEKKDGLPLPRQALC